MICIYLECYPGALQTSDGRRLDCKAKWHETSAKNLRSAVGAIEHNPWVQPPKGQIQVEIDGIMFETDQLPKYGRDLLKRCSFWLQNLRRSQTRLSMPRPVFGL
jgi:hypothetical protein